MALVYLGLPKMKTLKNKIEARGLERQKTTVCGEGWALQIPWSAWS